MYSTKKADSSNVEVRRSFPEINVPTDSILQPIFRKEKVINHIVILFQVLYYKGIVCTALFPMLPRLRRDES